MKKLLMFLVLLTVSVGMWADPSISTTDGVCTITLDNPSDLGSLTYSETDLAATTLIVKCANAFDGADMSKINQFTNATTIDMAGCYTTWGNVNNLSSSKVEYLLLPAYANANDTWSSTVQNNCPNVKGVMRSHCAWGGASGDETFVEVTEEDAFGKMSGLLANHTETWNSTPVFTVTGPMDATSYAGLNNQAHSSFNLSGVTLASGVDALSLANTSVEYVRMPNGVEFSSVNNPTGCTNLKVAFSSSSDGTKAYAHVTEGNQGELATFTSNASLNSGIATIPNWTISGYLQNSDVRNTDTNFKNITGENVNDGQGYGALPNNIITSIDLTNAVFDCDELTVNGISGTLLSSVKFPDNSLTCKTIPAYCAYMCEGLTSAEIPSTYTAIGAHAFHQTKITRIKIGKNVTSVGDHAFTACNELNTVEFEKGIHDLDFEPYSFAGITCLKHVVLPEGVRNLGEYMFQQCVNLESIRLPSTLRHIDGHCFEGCSKLKQIAIPAGVETIGRNAFSNSGLRDIYLMASTVDEIPLIYPFTTDPSNDYPQSTFARNKLVSNNQDIGKTKAEVANMTTEEVHELYHSLDNIPAFLHYNPALRDFIDYNPHYPGTDTGKEGSPAEEKYISDTYIFVDHDGQHWPKQNDGSYRGDFVRILEAGLIDNTSVEGQQTSTGLENMTRFAWRQFMLKFGDAEPGKTVYEKELKDVWYTMCFPYDLTDEQLEEFLNAEYNICEFSGVEVTENTSDDGSVSKSLILHFNDIASELVIYDDLEDDTKDVKYLAYAGHPYMIHPNIGTVNENLENVENYRPEVVCYIPGVKDLSVDKQGNLVSGYQPGDTRTQEIFDGTTKTLTCYQDQIVMKDGEIFSYTDKNGDVHSNMTFRFIGNYNDGVVIPYGAYFLGTKSGDIYPKYWRENSKDANRTTGMWTKYTAIVIPDDNTEAWLKTVNSDGAGVKSMDISFNDWDAIINPDALNIETLVDEKSENKTNVQYFNIVYDFNGNIVKKGDASIENLPTGMYIVNGKKYFVK